MSCSPHGLTLPKTECPLTHRSRRTIWHVILKIQQNTFGRARLSQILLLFSFSLHRSSNCVCANHDRIPLLLISLSTITTSHNHFQTRVHHHNEHHTHKARVLTAGRLPHWAALATQRGDSASRWVSGCHLLGSSSTGHRLRVRHAFRQSDRSSCRRRVWHPLVFDSQTARHRDKPRRISVDRSRRLVALKLSAIDPRHESWFRLHKLFHSDLWRRLLLLGHARDVHGWPQPPLWLLRRWSPVCHVILRRQHSHTSHNVNKPLSCRSAKHSGAEAVPACLPAERHEPVHFWFRRWRGLEPCWSWWSPWFGRPLCLVAVPTDASSRLGIWPLFLW